LKRVLVLLVVFVVGVMCVPGASAQSAEEAKVADTFQNWINARNAADAEALAKTWVSPASIFWAGDLLVEFEFTTDELTGMIQGQFEGGREDVLTAHHVDVRIFGEAALLTCYVSGTFVQDEETKFEGAWSFSSLWVKVGGQWKLTHFQQSPSGGGPPTILSGEVVD